MNDVTHMNKEDFLRFQQNLMNQTEKEAFLNHIGGCDYCADYFATLLSDDIILAPRNMKANILMATKRPDVVLAKKMKETSKRLQLFWYSLKVGTAMACALLLLGFTLQVSNPPTIQPVEVVQKNPEEIKVPITTKIRNNMDYLSYSILTFSNNIMKTEGTNYDQQKK